MFHGGTHDRPILARRRCAAVGPGFRPVALEIDIEIVYRAYHGAIICPLIRRHIDAFHIQVDLVEGDAGYREAIVCRGPQFEPSRLEFLRKGIEIRILRYL